MTSTARDERPLSLRKDSGRDDSRPFRRVLIANRGEIAVRLIRACRELGCQSVAVYSDADVDALHRRLADESVHLGPAAPSESYLKIDAIIAAALQTDAAAVHPGYGFLSERAELAEACAAAGLVFIGPEPKTLRSLGDKLAARASAAGAGVPTVPGTFEPVRSGTTKAETDLVRHAEQIGWPVLVKASAGGGGRGMRRVDSRAGLAEAVGAASREAGAAFGDGSVYLERYVERGRHVEVQLLGDVDGHIVALGERDCSVQRRHQKLVEEAPAPGLTVEQRRHVHELAVRVARTVGLRNAATAEFLLTPEGEFWFLEVNARLQVEHGVTELVSGLDLVHEQMWLAAGKPLSARVVAAAGRADEPNQHAIEVRIGAEDPAHDFAPVPGRVDSWREPGGPGVRVDSGVEEGTKISADYDPLLAKLLVVAPDRRVALARLARALDEFEIGGLQTTLPFHRWLVEQADFASGERLSTDLVARLWEPGPLVGDAAHRAAELAGRYAAESRSEPAGRTVPAASGDDRRRSLDDSALSWWTAGIREATDRWR